MGLAGKERAGGRAGGCADSPVNGSSSVRFRPNRPPVCAAATRTLFGCYTFIPFGVNECRPGLNVLAAVALLLRRRQIKAPANDKGVIVNQCF